MEENKPKRERIKAKPVASRKLRAPDKKDKIIELYDSGFNINQIGAMLAVHTVYVKDVINKANEEL